MKAKERNNRHTHVNEVQPKARPLEANEMIRIDDEIAALKKQIIAIHQSKMQITLLLNRPR